MRSPLIFSLLVALCLPSLSHATLVTIDGSPAGAGDPVFNANDYATGINYPIFHFDLSRADHGTFDINSLELYAPAGPGVVYELAGYRDGEAAPAMTYVVLPPPVFTGFGPRGITLTNFTGINSFHIVVSSDIFTVNSIDVHVASVAEPAPLALAGAGLMGLLLTRRRQGMAG